MSLRRRSQSEVYRTFNKNKNSKNGGTRRVRKLSQRRLREMKRQHVGEDGASIVAARIDEAVTEVATHVGEMRKYCVVGEAPEIGVRARSEGFFNILLSHKWR